jgi:hypothetical protein
LSAEEQEPKAMSNEVVSTPALSAREVITRANHKDFLRNEECLRDNICPLERERGKPFDCRCAREAAQSALTALSNAGFVIITKLEYDELLYKEYYK